MKLSSIKPNAQNPRIIKDERFKKLCQQIEQFPKMMALRPIVVDADGVILGGNMRFKALQHLGFKEIPDNWVRRAEELTEEEKRRFVITDNVGFGEWQWEELANEWNAEELMDWGLDVPDFAIMPTDDELIGEEKNKPATMKITFTTPEQLQAAEIDIQELLDRKYKGAYFSVSAGEV
jgi:ParB-like chromosome segregation protein Spo0J